MENVFSLNLILLLNRNPFEICYLGNKLPWIRNSLENNLSNENIYFLTDIY